MRIKERGEGEREGEVEEWGRVEGKIERRRRRRVELSHFIS